MKRIVMALPRHESLGETWSIQRKLGYEKGKDTQRYLEKLGFIITDDTDTTKYMVLAPDGWTLAWNNIKEEGTVYDQNNKPVFSIKKYRLLPFCSVFELQHNILPGY